MLSRRMRVPVTFCTIRGGKAPVDPESRDDSEKDESLKELPGVGLLTICSVQQSLLTKFDQRNTNGF